jgi:hypothetical protein
LPLKKNEFFVGRDYEIQKIYQKMKTTSSILSLTGQGGAGKTQIAVEYAYRHANEYSSIVWIDGTSTESIEQGFLEKAHHLWRKYYALGHYNTSATFLSLRDLFKDDGLDTHDNLDQKASSIRRKTCLASATKIMLDWFNTPENKHWLLVIDNLDDQHLLEDIERFIPTSSWGNILLTTRVPSSKWQEVVVGRMSEEAAFDMLSTLGNLNITKNSTGNLPCSSRYRELIISGYSTATRLFDELGYLALSIAHCCAYVKMFHVSLGKYLILLDEDPQGIFAKAGPLRGYRKDTILSTYEISFARLRETNAFAADLLLLCGFLAREHIPKSLLRHSSPYSGGKKCCYML